MCDTLFETITNLRPPTYGFPTVWDVKYGAREDLTQLSSVLLGAQDTLVIAGRRLDKDDFSIKSLYLAEVNRRGRALMEKDFTPKVAEHPVKMLMLGDDIIMLSGMTGRNAREVIRLSWHKKDDFAMRFDKTLSDSTYHYKPINIVKAAEGNGFVAVLHAVSAKNPNDNHGVLVRYSASGSQLWKRSYRPGIPNSIFNVQPIDESAYLAVGEIKQEDGRMGAWAMRLAYDGAIGWQRTYPRGKTSSFHGAAMLRPTIDGQPRFVVSGFSEPLDNKPDAAFVMGMDSLGEPMWSRYYRRDDYALHAKWIRAEDDDRISVVIDAEASDEIAGVYDHVRMLSLSPRGALLTDEAYYVGLGSRVKDFISGWNGERIVATTIQDDLGMAEPEDVPLKVIGLMPDDPPMAEKDDGPQRDPIQKGWVMIGTTLEPYSDPCKVP